MKLCLRPSEPFLACQGRYDGILDTKTDITDVCTDRRGSPIFTVLRDIILFLGFRREKTKGGDGGGGGGGGGEEEVGVFRVERITASNCHQAGCYR